MAHPNDNMFTCQHCGKSFTDEKHKNRKYCSEACSTLSTRKRETIPCDVCGAPFLQHIATQRFCSLTCKGIASRKIVVLVCATCGNDFTPKENRKDRVEKYCSPECRKIGRARGKAITKTCAQCKVEYTRPDWKVWRESKYCSPECRQDAFRAMPQSEREAIMAGCRAATRGSKQTDEHRNKIARTKQELAKLSRDEAEIIAALNAAGLFPVPLYAVHRYNIDFAFPDIKLAIEYNGGNWHNSETKKRIDEIKTAYLESQGWTVVFFPRLNKRRSVDSGNERIALASLVSEVKRLIHSRLPRSAA